MKKNKIFVACDTTNINKIREIINKTQNSKLKVGYKFGLEFLNSKNGRSFVSKIKNKFVINHRVTNKDIKITNYVYFLKNDKNVSLSSENWYNLAKINVGIPKYFDKAIKVYRSEYEKNYVQKVEKRG